MDFLRESEDLANCRPSVVKVTLDSTLLEFQSVKAQIVKNNLFRYKAPRGDREERDFFVSVQPDGIFKSNIFDIQVQGDMNRELAITFDPDSMEDDHIQGFLSVIDEYGKKMAGCDLIGTRQSMIKATPSLIDAGLLK